MKGGTEHRCVQRLLNINNCFSVYKFIARKSKQLRGQGVPDLEMVKIEFYVVSNRGEPQLPDAFYRKLSHSEILKIQVITVRARTLIAITQK